jgi:uncharacterized membrane protein YphA (DoxX/SURF4 family)
MMQNIFSLFALLLRAGLAATLVTSGAAKMTDLRGFATTLVASIPGFSSI